MFGYNSVYSYICVLKQCRMPKYIGCQRIWDTSEISRKTKLKLLKTIVSGAVLMYGCEA